VSHFEVMHEPFRNIAHSYNTNFNLCNFGCHILTHFEVRHALFRNIADSFNTILNSTCATEGMATPGVNFSVPLVLKLSSSPKLNVN
jgi:hypothetical protein